MMLKLMMMVSVVAWTLVCVEAARAVGRRGRNRRGHRMGRLLAISPAWRRMA